MKKLIMFIAVVASMHSFAASKTVIEFDEAQEKKCHTEIQALKCTDQAGEELSDCVEAKKAKLSAECKKMHAAKMNNK
jgi:hypothetical protein